MSLTLEDIKKMHDAAFTSGSDNRERAATEMSFYYVTQWDDTQLQNSQISFKGEFDLLRKAGRDILSDLTMNRVQIDFEPEGDTPEQSIEALDGIYRKRDLDNLSVEAYEVGQVETVICGAGAWELYTEYQDYRGLNTNQIIRRRPLHEANNTVYWDPGARRLDKSDAKYCSILEPYSEDGYRDLVHELTGQDKEEINLESFSTPEDSYQFIWRSPGDKLVYVVNFYHSEQINDKILGFEDDFGRSIEVYQSQIKEVEDELIDAGFRLTVSKSIKNIKVTKYIASGTEILSEQRIAGRYIPVVPMYGERAFINGSEYYEGMVRIAKDPQQLRNFQMSYLADIVAQGPREKPIFFPEQIKGFEYMYELNGVDNRYAYLLQNFKSPGGEPLPVGPVGVLPDTKIPEALSVSIELTERAVEAVANPGLPQDISDPDVSGKAVLALQAKLDKQSMVYQSHFKHAKRRDAEIFASMSSEVYDSYRSESILLPDGRKKKIQLMDSVIDRQTGQLVIINNLSQALFNVTIKTGKDYQSQKEQILDRIQLLIPTLDPNDPIKKALQLKLLMLTEGSEMEDIRQYANIQLVLAGVKKPETPEEEQVLQQAQNTPKEPSPEMVLAKAEELKGKADILQEKREGVQMQLNHEKDKQKIEVDMYNAITKRLDMEARARKDSTEVTNQDINKATVQLKDQTKIVEQATSKEVTQEINAAEDMSSKSTEELYAMLT